jgi:hypothetical protein
MRVNTMLRTGVAVLVANMRSLFTSAGRNEWNAGEKGNDAGQRHGKNVKRKVMREDFIAFSAVASAYLLAWAASRVFQQ